MAEEGDGIGIALAQGGWLASLGLVMSAGLAGSAQTTVRLADLLCAGCLGVYVVMVEGVWFMWLWTQAPIIAGAVDRSDLLGFSLAMLPVNAVFTALIYRRAVADVELMRRKETE